MIEQACKVIMTCCVLHNIAKFMGMDDPDGNDDNLPDVDHDPVEGIQDGTGARLAIANGYF